jgi:hypothetical protein
MIKELDSRDCIKTSSFMVIYLIFNEKIFESLPEAPGSLVR